MPEDRSFRPPLVSRWLIRTASWIVPERARSDWRFRWDSGLRDLWVLVERGELAAGTDAEVNRHCWGAFKDAFFIRFSREHLRDWLRGPACVLTCCATALVLITALSRGFVTTRAISQPVPVRDPGSLISVRFTGAMYEPMGVPPRLIPVWRAQSKLLADLAGYRYRRNSTHAWVTTNFFSLLGTDPALGRLFRPGDTDVAVLSGKTWQTTFGRDPRVIGSTIPVDGKPFTIVGVLPDTFWAISGTIAVWTPLVLEPRPPYDTPFLIGALARTKPESNEAALRKELLTLTRQNGYAQLEQAPQVLAFSAVPERVIYRYLFGTGFALAVGLVLIAIARPSFSGHGWRYWGFFAAKTTSVIAILPLLWIEGNAALAVVLPRAEVSMVVSGVLVTLVFIVSIGCGLFWSFYDQRRRCPVCLQWLAMPVTIGSWGSALEPVSIEFLCEHGHGSLCLPETDASESERWRSMDDSWRELFEDKK